MACAAADERADGRQDSPRLAKTLSNSWWHEAWEEGWEHEPRARPPRRLAPDLMHGGTIEMRNKWPLFLGMIAHTVGAHIGAPFLTNWILHTVPMKPILERKELTFFSLYPCRRLPRLPIVWITHDHCSAVACCITPFIMARAL